MRPALLTCGLLLVLAGCVGSLSPASDGPTRLPSADGCATDALPDPDTTDGLMPSGYPTPPDRVDGSTVTGYIVGFERAYYRNLLIAEAADDPDTNLTRATVSAEAERVTRTDDGWAVVLATTGGTRFESGIHGDHWPTVGYFVNDSRLTRARLASVNASVRNTEATTLLRCPE